MIGLRPELRIAISDDVAPRRVASIVARCREEEPGLIVRFFPVAYRDQVKGLLDGVFHAGFSHSDEDGESLLAEPLWSDPLIAVVPRGHPLLARSSIPLEYVIDYPLVLCYRHACEGCSNQIGRTLKNVSDDLVVAERALTHELLVALVAKDYGVGLTSGVHCRTARMRGVAARPLEGRLMTVTTYLLRPRCVSTSLLVWFIQRVRACI